MAKRGKGPHPFRVAIVRYVDGDGNRCKSGDPGAQKVKTESATYYADLHESGKRVRVALGTDNLAVAWERLRQKLKERKEHALGIRDEFTAAAEKTLEQHLDDWIAVVRTTGISDKQVQTLRHSLDVLAGLAGWKRITDLTHDSCAKALAEMMKAGRGRRKGRSIQTRNHYLKHAKQFTRWAATVGSRLRRDPLAGLGAIDASTDRRHDRRSPTDEEIARLFEALERPDAVAVEGMTAAQRALGYRLCMATGFRAGELRSLTRGNFDLGRGTVTVAAAYSKHRREDTQELPPWLVAQLAAHFEAGGGCWESFPANHPGQVLKVDLAVAGVPYSIVGQGGHELFFDFHSLRHYFCTVVGNMAGISPRTLLALTRHSTVELALKRYAKPNAAEITKIIQAMPEPGLRRE